jgi:ABC-2 type transport system ATP-binding protein
MEFVHALANDGTAVLFSTHYLHEVDDSAVRLVILDHGRTIAEGNVSDLLKRCGHSAVELSFHGPAPQLNLPFPSEQHDNVLRIKDEDPAAALAIILPALGSEVQRLSGIEILRPSLDGVFAELTGHHFDVPTDTDSEPTAISESRVNVVPA